MRIFDPHIHMTSRTTDDYEAMWAAGVRAVVEPAFWLGEPRTSVGSFVDHFNALVGWERFRAAQFGIRHHCALALNPKEANDEGLRADVLAILPRYLAKDGVVAVGEVGYDEVTPSEDEALAAQLELAADHDLPVLVHTPHRDKLEGTRRTLAVIAESGLPPEQVLVDHNNELTVRLVADSGCWMGFSIYPHTKMDAPRMVRVLREFGPERMVVNSAADWGRSDPLAVARTASAMVADGFGATAVDTVVWRNPVAFFGASGRLDVSPLHPASYLAGTVGAPLGPAARTSSPPGEHPGNGADGPDGGGEDGRAAPAGTAPAGEAVRGDGNATGRPDSYAGNVVTRGEPVG